MVEFLMQKRELISFRQEIKFRNKLLETAMEWTSDFAAKAESQTAEDEKVSRDLDLACMKVGE